MTSSAEFRCLRCGECCRWAGCVKLASGEAEAIAAYLGIPEEEFFDKFTRIAPDRSCLALTEKSSGECIYLELDECGRSCCRINPVKPRQCRDFPVVWNFPGWQKECRGGAAMECGTDNDEPSRSAGS